MQMSPSMLDNFQVSLSFFFERKEKSFDFKDKTDFKNI